MGAVQNIAPKQQGIADGHRGSPEGCLVEAPGYRILSQLGGHRQTEAFGPDQFQPGRIDPAGREGDPAGQHVEQALAVALP